MTQDATATATSVRNGHGFDVYALRSDALELAVVPELGARIISLKSVPTGREWMWHPNGGLRLFRNRLGDDFSESTLAGTDECLPTIGPCTWQGRELPDHGEAWSCAWKVDAAAWKDGVLKTSVALAVSPFDFERVIIVRGNGIRMDYTLSNRSPVEQRFLWALHPLLRLQEGDKLQLPATTKTLLGDETWLDAVDSMIPEGGCAKAFAVNVTEGIASVHNPVSGDRLTFEWDPAQNNTLGLWLTRGGWHGHHHFAIEPTNGSPDPLTDAARQGQCGVIPPFGTAVWKVCLRVGE